MSARLISRIAIVAAIYAIFTVLPPFSAIGYGPVQVRVSEALTVLPYIAPWAPWSLYLGCILANLGSPFLVWDLTLGAFGTLVAALLTRKVSKPYLAPLPPVIINALTVSVYIAPAFELPYWLSVLQIAAGELIACYVLGYPLLLFLLKNDRAKALVRGD